MPAEFPLASGVLVIRPLPGGTGLVLAGEADLTCQAALADALAPLAAGGTGEICLDLTGLHFIDVACARELISLAGCHPGARVIVRNPPRCLRRITALLGTHIPLEFSGTPQPGQRPGRRTPAAPLVTAVPPSRPQSPQVIYVTSGVQAAEHVLSRACGTVRIDARGRGGGMRLAQTTLSPSVRFDHVSFSMCVDVTAAPQNALPIGQLRSGRVRCVSDGSERSYRPGDVFLAVQPGHPCTARIENTDLEVAVLDPDLVRRVAGTAPDRSRQPVRFTGYEPVSPQAAAAWTSACDYVRQLAHDPDASAQPLIAGSASRVLAAAALAAFPNNALPDPTAADRHDAHPATLRRAVSFIDDNAHRDISAADIAAAAHVTLRAIQLVFRRYLDTTPMDYLRRVRLEHAHQDLAHATPDGELTVTKIAYRWGFTSHSRFSSLHRRAYGVTPSQTLRHG